MKQKPIRQLAAVMFADIVGYTAIMQDDEAYAAAIRARHREVFEHYHTKFAGRIIQYYGDGVLSVFKSAVEAVNCGMEIQKTLSNGEPLVPLRIGIHLGDIVFDNTEVYGDGVNCASRIESLGIPGAVLLSGKVNEELHNQKDITTRSMGIFELKNISHPLEVFALTNPGVRVPEREEIQGKRSASSKSLAVLPFVNMSSDEENEFFCDGMTEEIINALTRVNGLRVTSRTSSFYFKGKPLPTPEIGRQLQVSTILEGSIRLAGTRIRITAQLIDVEEDFHFWSESFDRSMDDIFAVQDEISLLIADKLREHVGHLDIHDHLVPHQEVPVGIYKRYLKSRFLLLKMSREDIDRGMLELKDIISEFPSYPLAQLGLNLGYTLLGTLGLIPAEEAFMLGKRSLDKALQLEPDLPECQLHLSWSAFLQEWDLEKAYRHLNKLRDLQPGIDFYQTMACTIVAEGKSTAAMNYINTAFELDPFSEINYHLKGFIYYIDEKYLRAEKYFREGIELKPESQVSVLYLGLTLILMHKLEEALEFFTNIPEVEGDLTRPGGLALAWAALNQPEEAAGEMALLTDSLKSHQVDRATYLLILCHTISGEHKKALEYLKQGATQRLPMMVYLNVEPLIKPLRKYREFREIMANVPGPGDLKLPEETRYKTALLNKDELSEYRNKLQQLMTEEKPYLQADLTLRSLAEMLSIPPNHLSQLLNEGFGKNFAEFVNTYRVEAFKKMAVDSKYSHLTILAIALESGFNSKTVFNTWFSKLEGVTPKSYLQNITN